MDKHENIVQHVRTGTVGTALVVLAGLFFLPYSTGQWLADLSFDLPFRWRPYQPVKGAMIICMDELSARERGGKWAETAWARTNHARLLNRLRDCQAKAVVFDIRFAEPSPGDEDLIAALQAARQAGMPVIIGGEVEASKTPSGSVMTNLVAPMTNLEAVAAWGLAEWQLGGAPLRRHFLGTEEVPSLAMRAAELTPRLPRRPWPAERWINFYGPPGWIPHRRYAQALDPAQTPVEVFSNQVCFVGDWPSTPLAGGVRADEWSTPYSRWGGGKAPGVEINATVYQNLVRGDWLRRLPAWGEVCIVLGAGIFFGFGLSLCRPTLAAPAGLGAAVMVTVAASWWMWHQHVWFSWLIVAGVQIPVAVVWSALAFTRRLAGEKALLESRLATQAATNAGTATGETTVEVPIGSPARPPEWRPAIPDHTLLRCVGRGGYGEVWLARNAIGSYHAVKIVRRELFEHSDPFEREFRGLQKFMPISRSHPGLVQILHVGRRDADGFIYYVMEAADDESTGPQINPESYSPRNLAKEIRKRGHLPVVECLQLALDLTAALDFLHRQQLIHRDIKPANIIFVKSAPKFADIGLVTDIATTGHTVTYVGTRGYIAPEGPGTPAADLYSLGKVLYEASMGLGREQFPGLPQTLAQRADQADLLKLNKVILKACRQDAAQRFQSAAEMREDLLRCKSGGRVMREG